MHTWFDAQLDQKILDGLYHSSISLVLSGTATCYKKVYCTTELCPFFHQPIRYFFTTFHNAMMELILMEKKIMIGRFMIDY